MVGVVLGDRVRVDGAFSLCGYLKPLHTSLKEQTIRVTGGGVGGISMLLYNYHHFEF